MHYTVSNFVTADGFVDVTMHEQTYEGYRYVKLGVSLQPGFVVCHTFITRYPYETLSEIVSCLRNWKGNKYKMLLVLTRFYL